MKNIIVEKSFSFSVEIMKFAKVLRDHEKEYDLARQLFRSGTSIGANIHEGQNSPSKKDFINKMNIALKEANETKYWLALVESAEFCDKQWLQKLIEEANDLHNILTRIIITARKNIVA